MSRRFTSTAGQQTPSILDAVVKIEFRITHQGENHGITYLGVVGKTKADRKRKLKGRDSAGTMRLGGGI